MIKKDDPSRVERSFIDVRDLMLLLSMFVSHFYGRLVVKSIAFLGLLAHPLIDLTSSFNTLSS